MTPRWHPDRFADRLPYLRRRARLIAAIRAFFHARGYVEVETPYAVPAPGEEVHLSAFATERRHPDGGREPLYLHTSPEFAMKRLLVAGAGPIFQIARVWRNGEGGALHAAEFSLLEWYRPGASLDALIAETMALLRAVLPPVVACRGVTTALSDYERITVAEAFARDVGADVLACGEDAAALAAAKTPWVLGTTGLFAADEAAIAAAARDIAICAAPNFSPGVTLLLALAERMAAALPAESYDAEIVEMHHRQKVDAPSGTALGLGRAVAAGRGVELAEVMESGRHGQTGARKPGAIGFAALRGGQVVGEHSLIFAGAHEHIALTHRAFDRRIFAQGALRAALWLAGKPPGLYSMRDVLGLAG